MSQHFDRDELERDGDLLPLEAIGIFSLLCRDVLEPLRLQFGEAFHITSGYRSPYSNRRIGGAPESQHVANGKHCAVDGYFASHRKDMRPVFDWLRESKLPFDQCILEHGKNGDVIHISYTMAPRRMALEGATFNQSAYKSWSVAGAAGVSA